MTNEKRQANVDRLIDASVNEAEARGVWAEIEADERRQTIGKLLTAMQHTDGGPLAEHVSGRG